MRLFLLTTFLCFMFTSVNSQQLSIEAGKSTSSFDYKNSQGETLNNLQSSNHTYLSLGYRTGFFAKGLFVNFNANFKEYGAIGSDPDFDNYFEWDLSYLGTSIAFDFEVIKPGNFTIYIKALTGIEFLTQGTQTLNNQVFNLSDEEDFDSANFVLSGGLGVQYRASQTISVFTQYMYGTTSAFKDVQGDLKINTHNVGLGLLIDLNKSDDYLTSEDNAQITELKKDLEDNKDRLAKLEEEHVQKVDELESRIAKQENEIMANNEDINKIKITIERALKPYSGDNLIVEERDGRVYILFENDFLFKSGSWNLDEKGMDAVSELGDFLANNPDTMVTIEGHTDDVSFSGNGNLNSNWDLSTKRATSVVQLLEQNESINPKNLIVAGRAQYDAIADNTTEDGKAKNRRITIIISPKLEELFNMTKN